MEFLVFLSVVSIKSLPLVCVVNIIILQLVEFVGAEPADESLAVSVISLRSYLARTPDNFAGKRGTLA